MTIKDYCWLGNENEISEVGVEVYGDSLVIQTVKKELENGLINWQGKIILGRLDKLPDAYKRRVESQKIGKEGYLIKESEGTIWLVGGDDLGVLYGMFHLDRLMRCGRCLDGILIEEEPVNGIRMINHWDNMDENEPLGGIERGYAGHSIFFENHHFVADKGRIVYYARLLASIGINCMSLNNVNVHETETKLITDEFLPDVAELASIFRRYGIKLYLCINFASPKKIGGLNTADPQDVAVRKWWKKTIDHIYQSIPDFGGFVIKADSEGEPGPFEYGRSHVDGANMFGELLQAHGGIVFWRCFVYNCKQDWRDRTTDRAKAAYEHFMPLDGAFADNVILQIKHGPIDFQIREPVSPLLGAMTQTNQAIEFQITQEYTGHATDICFLPTMWKEVLAFDTYALGQGSTIDKIANGRLYNRPYSGITAISNIGNDDNWTGHKLAQANLYGYGRLAWNPSLSVSDIVDEWVKLTFGNNEKVKDSIKHILLASRQVFENYTVPLGIGFMVETRHHYEPSIDAAEYSEYGNYHFADRHGVGVNRSATTGTNYVRQYFDHNFELYNNLETCPDELLLFFHHVPYTHVLKSGKTVIQHIYDTHFQGVESVEKFIEMWNEIEDLIDEASFKNVQDRLVKQLQHAIDWRDQINTYFYRKSGIADELERVIY